MKDVEEQKRRRVFEIGHPQFESLAQNILGQGNSLCFRATGQSMLPFIREGDMVMLDPVSRIPRLGDVILGRVPGGRLLLHRVVERRPVEVVTRGDATDRDDMPIPLEHILGLVSAIPGRGGNLHLKFPLRLLLVRKPALRRILHRIPGIFLLKRILVRLLS